MAILLMGIVAIVRMPADIFPEINIPVVSAIWTYAGVSPDEMADVITTRCERGFTTGVNDIEHMESQSLAGISVIKMFFHPKAQIDAAVAQVTAQSQSILAVLPNGIHPPNVIRYNAASVPILQLGISSDTLSEQAALRSDVQLHAHAARQHAGREFPAPVRRQASPDHGRFEPGFDVRARPFRQRCFERAEQSKPDSSHRQRQNRHARISRGAEQQPARRRKRSTICR